jgi:protein pelota
LNEIGIKPESLRMLMRILWKDDNNGNTRVMLEADEDIWHLFNIIEIGDQVTASTTRRVE